MITKIITLFFIIIFIFFIFHLFQKKSNLKNKSDKTHDGIVDLEKDPETDEYKPKE